MANQTKGRRTEEMASGGKTFVDPVAAATNLFEGALVALDAAGNAIKAAPASPVLRGVAVRDAINESGAAGDVSVETKKGTFKFLNADLDRTDIGDNVFVVDDQTVGSTGTLVAGRLEQIDTGYAWVKIS